MELLRVRDVWSSVRVVPGVQSVMMLGVLMMPLWSVDSWDMRTSVSNSCDKLCELKLLPSFITLQMLRHTVLPVLVREVGPSTWTRLAVLVMKQCWEIALPIQLEFMTALTLKMLELVVKVCVITSAID